MRISLPDLTTFWWRRAPLAAGRLSRRLTGFLADGIYLAAWPAVGALAPAAAGILGLLLGWGWLRPEHAITYSYSLPVMLLLVAVSHLGGAIGAWLWIGFVLADFFFFPRFGLNAPTVAVRVFQDYVPVWTSYAVLAVVLVLVPATASNLRHRTLRPWGLPKAGRLVGGGTVQAGIQAALTWVWILAAPILIRPVFTLRHLSPPAEAFQPLQLRGDGLIVAAAVMGVLRTALEGWALAAPERASRVEGLLVGLIASVRRRAAEATWLSLIGRVLLMTLLLLGLVERWPQVWVLLGAVAAVVVLRDVLVPRAAAWNALLRRIPVLVRFGAGLLGGYLLTRAVIVPAWRAGGASMRPALLVVVLSLALFAALLPEASSPVGRVRVGTRAGGAIMLLVLLLGVAAPAHADNCSSIRDCFYGVLGAILAILALIIIIVIVFFFIIGPMLMSWLDDIISGSYRSATPGPPEPPGGAPGAGGAGGLGGEAGGGIAGTTRTAATAEELAAQHARFVAEETGAAAEAAAAASEEVAAADRMRQITQAFARDLMEEVDRGGLQAVEQHVRTFAGRWGTEGLADLAAEMERVIAGGSSPIPRQEARIILQVIQRVLGS